ncbi:hypothetical protein AQJ23_17125 [Streptomyces antibioticus]|nr:hypothetical protein AQJ23_17125 [Streptomyces antibioticus]
MPFVTTTVQLPSAHALSSAGVEGFIGFTAAGDGDEDFVGVGEAGEGSAEREGAADADADASPPESEPQPVSAATRARTQTIPAARATGSPVLRRRVGVCDVVMGPFYAQAPGRGPARPTPRTTRPCSRPAYQALHHHPHPVAGHPTLICP